MKLFLGLISLFFISIISSCVRMNLIRNDYTSVCPVHEIKLKKGRVRASWDDSVNINKYKECPYAKRTIKIKKPMRSWPKKWMAIVLTCDSCTIVYKKLVTDK